MSARDAVWGQVSALTFETPPEDVIDRALDAWLADPWDAPVGRMETVVSAVTGDPEPDILLGLFALDLAGHARKDGLEGAGTERGMIAYATSAILAVHKRQAELEAEVR